MVIADIFAFAREKRLLKDVIALKDCERLSDVLANFEGEIAFEIKGVEGKNRKIAIALTLNGVVPLTCQRCLEHLDYHLAQTTILELAPENAEIAEDEIFDENYEIYPTPKVVDVADLVEDEIILALPNFPRHDSCRSFDYGRSTE